MLRQPQMMTSLKYSQEVMKKHGKSTHHMMLTLQTEQVNINTLLTGKHLHFLKPIQVFMMMSLPLKMMVHIYTKLMVTFMEMPPI